MDTNIPVRGSITDKIAPISRQIWDAKYRLKTPHGTPVDIVVEDTWRRPCIGDC